MKALIVIDMQMDMQHRINAGRDCVNPDASDRIVTLTSAFREQGLPVLHVRHRDDDPASPMHRGAAGYPPMPCDAALEGEPVFEKTTSSAFASTNLEAYLRDHDIDELVVAGAVAGFCVNSTTRAGADLGFKMTVVGDAVLGFDLVGHSAQTIYDVTMAHLEADFAKITTTDSILSR